MTFTATYSPEDNKLRLSASSRLDKELYARVRAAGFIWAPKQEIFVAPMWTPEREDLCTELAGEIEDEDTTLVDRAEQRAERFEGYSERRADDAESARAGVARIADGIPLGQPILIGHHSEKHARRDAEKIENGMRRAVKMWETSKYWESRAAGAIRHAKYKELPAVRARRIKGLEADLRRCLKNKADSETFLKMWVPITNEEWDRARAIANYDHACSGSCFPLDKYPRLRPDASTYEGAMGLWSALDGIITPEQARDMATRAHKRCISINERWINHLENRLTYEHAMLEEGGGLTADKFAFAVGGRVARRGQWFVVTGLNRRDGQLLSVSVIGHWKGSIPVEEITDYREPSEGDAEKVKAVTKLAPLCNWPGEGFRHVEKANFKKTYSAWIHTFPATETHGAFRSYSTFKGGPGLDCHSRVGIFITDQKRKDPPALTKKPEPVTSFDKPAPTEPRFNQGVQFTRASPREIEASLKYDAMRESLKAGVQVVSAPQLFPTPPALAARMVEEAELTEGARVLEPSAGTGALVSAILADKAPEDLNQVIVAVELSQRLADSLRSRFNENGVNVQCGDFMEQNGNLGKFDAVLMNPPFVNAQDIAHIEHAVTFLKPGGRLVAICANRPRQQARLKPLVERYGGTWEDLPADTFKESGTSVNTAMLSLRMPEGA